MRSELSHLMGPVTATLRHKKSRTNDNEHPTALQIIHPALDIVFAALGSWPRADMKQSPRPRSTTIMGPLTGRTLFIHTLQGIPNASCGVTCCCRTICVGDLDLGRLLGKGPGRVSGSGCPPQPSHPSGVGLCRGCPACAALPSESPPTAFQGRRMHKVPRPTDRRCYSRIAILLGRFD
jgi:hypothetical protein